MESFERYEDFLERYKPIPNSSGDDLWDVADPLVIQFQTRDPQRVWTLFRGPWDEIFVKAGFHPNSSLGYFIAEVPRKGTEESLRYPFAPA